MKRFVTFEGGEGAGKSTQIRLVADALRALGHEVLTTREPGGSPLAERLRAFLLSPDRPKLLPADEALLFAAARADHLAKTIKPALERGAIVLCDRFADSTRAYQGVEVGEPLLHALHEESVGDDGPSLTFVFEIPAAEGLGRAAARRGGEAADRFEGEGLAFHVELSERFAAIAHAESGRCVTVDAGGGRGREDIAAEIVRALVDRFGLAVAPSAAKGRS
jgi:dTMP kinase